MADHHSPIESVRSGLGKLVVAGEAIAAALHGSFDEPTQAIDDVLWSVGVNAPSARMVTMARRELSSAAAFLQVDR